MPQFKKKKKKGKADFFDVLPKCSRAAFFAQKERSATFSKKEADIPMAFEDKASAKGPRCRREKKEQ